MYLVTGATGNVGKEVVEELLDAGEAVRVFTRDERKVARWGDKVDKAVGDLARQDTIAAALQGVRAAFLLPVGGAEGIEHVRNFIAAAQASGAPRVVLLSSFSAGAPTVQLAKHHAEREHLVRASGLPWTFVRPGTFMSNTFQWARSIKAERVVYNPHGDGKTAPVAPRDIAAVAARAMVTGGFLGQALEVTGPELLSTPDQVEILARVLGTPLRRVDVSVEAATRRMIEAGMPPPFAAALGELIERIRAGNGAVQTDTVERVTGRKPATFEAWAREHARAWTGD
ncbi:SDR family oxidoreductase [Sorangium sp. So ce1182]|uniref:SDR family oxidoreductase n=1 Tax=Sorangium sp. So ce1182 TaxID=3133334 RepID=UPI003F5FACC9